MAVVLTAFSSVFSRVPFIKPPDMQRMITPMPRSIVTFGIDEAVLEEKPINDQQTVQVAVSLPVAFAYRMINSELSIVQQGGAGTYKTGELQITGGMRGKDVSFTTKHVMPKFDTSTFAPIAGAAMWNMAVVPSYIIQSVVGPGFAPIVDYRIVNTAAPAAVAGTLSFLATFYEYDIEQVQMFPALVPGALTRDLA